MLRAVIFDMDGVIIDSEPQHARAGVMTLAQHGLHVTPEYCSTFIGSTTKHMFETIIRDHNLLVEVDVLEKSCNEYKRQLIKDEGYIPIPGIKELIINLYKKGVKLAIASSSTQHEIESTVKALGIAKYFDKLISSTKVANPKPEPDVFLKALKELGVGSNETIVFEDSTTGTLASYAASIPCIGYINKNSGKQDLSKASVLIESFHNIDYDYISDSLSRANREPITIAITKRLIIRELSVADINDMYRIYQNTEVTRYVEDMDEYLDTEIEKHKAYIKNIYGFYGYGLWGVFSKKSNILIGRCGIQNQKIDGKNEIELSYLLDYNHWGYGYAIECTNAILAFAFQKLELTRVVAVIDKLNTRSIKVAKQIGMALEKEICHKNRDCFLYSKTSSKEVTNQNQYLDKHHAATIKVYNQFTKHPDTSVYCKHFSHKKNIIQKENP